MNYTESAGEVIRPSLTRGFIQMKKVKLLPAAMTLLSVLYLIYVVSSEDTTLAADTVGGDPGGKLLPAVIAVFMIGGFGWITLKERPTGEKMDKGTVVLFAITLGLSIMYVLLTKYIGFIILSSVLLYALLYLYTTIGEERHAVKAILSGVGTVVLTTGVYTLMKLITKSISRAARNGSLPSVFSSTSCVAAIALVFVVIAVVILGLTLLKLMKKKGLGREGNACMITLATVLFLYVVFKQFFLVALAPGLLNY